MIAWVPDDLVRSLKQHFSALALCSEVQVLELLTKGGGANLQGNPPVLVARRRPGELQEGAA